MRGDSRNGLILGLNFNPLRHVQTHSSEVTMLSWSGRGHAEIANSWLRRCVKAQSCDTTGRSRQLLLAAMSPGLKTHLIVTQLYEFFKDKQLVKTKLLESESLFYLPAHMDLTFTLTVGATVVIFCTTCKYTRISNDSESCVMTVLRL